MVCRFGVDERRREIGSECLEILIVNIFMVFKYEISGLLYLIMELLKILI